MRSITKLLLGIVLGVGAASSAQAGSPLLFGFWDTYASPGDFTATLAPYSNLSYISLGTDTADVPGAINTAASHGMKAIVQVQQIFFPNGATALVPNPAGVWGTFAQTISAQVAANEVAAFYVFDEPTNSGVSLQNLTTEVNTIRGTFPNVPLMIIYSQPGGFLGLNLVNWVGIDCYSNGQWSCGNNLSYSQSYWDLRQQLTSTQRMVIVPQAGYQSNAGCCNAALTLEFQKQIALAIGDPAVVAIVPFIWPSFPGFTGLSAYNTGAGSLANTFLSIGTDYKNGYVFTYATYTPEFQFWNQGNNHFVTGSVIEGLSNGFEFYGIAWNTYATQVSGTVPLYRCDIVSGNHHFATTSSTCEGSGARNEGIYGYISLSPTPGTTPLVRYYNSSTGDFYDSIQPTIIPSNYHANGTVGYVPSSIVPVP